MKNPIGFHVIFPSSFSSCFIMNHEEVAFTAQQVNGENAGCNTEEQHQKKLSCGWQVQHIPMD